ncbi:sensor histidine kinase [Streptomyces sp. NPDC056600]|uniref:sensor histidine kinase n=1 Tax=Streptomyces sp. NPDC056600 TaxID=3345874 RepID=UPI00369C1C32
MALCVENGRLRVPPAAVDAMTALGAAALLVVGGLSEGGLSEGGGRLGVPTLVLLGACGLALAARRRAPLPVLVVTALCALGYQAAGAEVLAVPYLVAVYGAVRAGRRPFALAVSAVLLAALHVCALLLRDGQPLTEVLARPRHVLEVAWLVAAFAAGEAVRQAERRADEAERTREETARRRADEERLRIARELHDSLTHQISIVKLQAEVAVHVARRRGEEVPPALSAIQEAAREASRDLRATLEALRDDGTAPPRGLEHLSDLVERARSAGVGATLRVEGERRDVPAAVARTAYRIVQEALTNTARHAVGATTADVSVRHGADRLTVRIDDDGKAAPPAVPSSGLGLLGMRERVTALGGRLDARPRDGGGFTVRAELPVEPAS